MSSPSAWALAEGFFRVTGGSWKIPKSWWFNQSDLLWDGEWKRDPNSRGEVKWPPTIGDEVWARIESPRLCDRSRDLIDRNPPTKRDPKYTKRICGKSCWHVGVALCLLGFWWWKTLTWDLGFATTFNILHCTPTRKYESMKPLKMNQWNTCRIHFSNGGICMYFTSFSEVFCFPIPKALTLPQHHSPPTPTHLFHRGQKAYAVRRGGWNLQDFRDGGVQLILLVPPGRKTSKKTKKKNENPKILSNPLPLFQLFLQRLRLFRARKPQKKTTTKQTSTNPKKPSTVVNVTNPPRWLVVHHPPPITNQPSMPTSVAGG